MSNWLKKSDTSLIIANNDGDALYYNNRVHCYYYGCLQFMYHILHTKLNLSIDDIARESNPKINPGNGGSHVWLQNKFRDDLHKRWEKFAAFDLNNDLGKLKKLRTSADYGHDDINAVELESAHKLTIGIKKILNKKYNE